MVCQAYGLHAGRLHRNHENNENGEDKPDSYKNESETDHIKEQNAQTEFSRDCPGILGEIWFMCFSPPKE